MESTEELQSSAFTCLHYLFDVLDSGSEATRALGAESNVPQMGQTISTILDGIVEGEGVEVQNAAMNALRSLVRNVATRDLKASFLPGIVSKLAKVLVPMTKQRRNHVVLVGALEVLRDLFAATLGGTSSFQKTAAGEQKESQIITDKWLENAAIQLRPAIQAITNLSKTTTRSNVKEALARFCFTILKECRKTLSNSASIALETILSLSSQEEGEAIKFQLEMLLTSDMSLSGLLQTTLHNSLQSLPTQMQTSDEQLKLQKIQQLSTAYGILSTSGADTSFVDRLLAATLRDSVLATIQVPQSKNKASTSSASILPVQALDITTLTHADQNATEFKSPSPLVRHRGQENLLNAIQNFAVAATTTAHSSAFTADLARSLRQSRGETQIATFWLLLDCTQAMYHQHSDVDAFLVDASTEKGNWKEHLEDLYALSLSILSSPTSSEEEEPLDPRLQTLALRTLALKARVSGPEFRYELLDTLYPVLHTLATPNETLQADSITTLNIFTAACDYRDVKDLIVSNVDYLTNAVALKLNAFDVSPQGPQVLLMMVRLAGAGLLPYLEDTVGSIFAALEDYHGYPLLVEVLFRVLGVVAEEGCKAPQLAITGGNRVEVQRVKRERWEPTSVGDLMEVLRERKVEEEKGRERQGLEAHPKRPWKDSSSHLPTARDDNEEEEDRDEEPEPEDQPLDIPDPPPPSPKIYALLLKISDLTQHFLPSASPSLRTSLLALLKTTIPALATHENSFLPLINTLWPEIISRLEDEEAQVRAAALDCVGLLCEYAGEFMRSRILALWPALVEMYRKIAAEIVGLSANSSSKRQGAVLRQDALVKAVRSMRGRKADYSDTSTRLLWGSLVGCLVGIVEFVGLGAERFGEGLEMLEAEMGDEGVRRVLEGENADAVWLVDVGSGRREVPRAPMMEGVRWAAVTV